LAWALFLAPLCVVYYLSLLSVRLQQRTDELQLTVEELGVSRRREAELQDYAALITQAQEDERRRLARDLHDDTAQALIALARGLDSITVSPTAPTAPTEAQLEGPASRSASQPASTRAPAHAANAANDARFIAELGAMARQALENVRRACRDLRPSVLDDLGLAAALDALSADMNRRGLPCAFHMTGVERAYPATVEVTIYRIAQEALSNALRHAHSTYVRLELTYEADAICLVVADNGRGFDYVSQLRKARLARDSVPAPSATTDGATSAATDGETRVGLGLLGMRERAALIGASLDIQSVRGLGARLTLVARAEGE
jgi:signal transduction histidine kinase